MQHSSWIKPVVNITPLTFKKTALTRGSYSKLLRPCCVMLRTFLSSGKPWPACQRFWQLYIVQKIERIIRSLADLSAQSQSPPCADEHSACADWRFTSFKFLTQGQVRMLIDKGLGIFLPVINKLVNLSFETVSLLTRKRHLSCLLLRSITWTLPIRISVQLVISPIYPSSQKRRVRISSLSIWQSPSAIPCCNLRTSLYTVRKHLYLIYRMTSWCQWISNMSPCLFYWI